MGGWALRIGGRGARRIPGLCMMLALCASSSAAPIEDSAWAYDTWRVFTTADGLPGNYIRAVHLSGERVWVGTDGGLAMLEDGRWRSWTVASGLPWAAVSAIETERQTGDLWLGTWGGGLVRFSGGRFDRFDQFNSALAGNMVFDITISGGRIWVATNGGISAFDVADGSWSLYAERRADRPETAVANFCVFGDSLYAAVWTGEIQRYDSGRDRWMNHTPTAAAGRSSRPRGVLAMAAVGTGLRSVSLNGYWRWDGRGSWTHHPSHGLWGVGNMVQCFTAAEDGRVLVGTDRGLHILTDSVSETWLTYRHGEDATITPRGGQTIPTRGLPSTIPDDRIRCLAADKNGVWVGTANGLAHATNRVPINKIKPNKSDRRESTTPAKLPPPPAIEIAFLGPATRTVALPAAEAHDISRSTRPDLLAIQLAVERANSRGGYRDTIPFSMASAPEGYVFANYGWSTFEDEYLALGTRRSLCGLVGHLRAGSCASTLTALRTEAPLVNVSLTPPTADESISPWVFRAPIDGTASHQRIIDFIIDTLGVTRFAVLRTAGEPSRRHVDDWIARVTSRGHRVVAEIAVPTGAEYPNENWSPLRNEAAEVVLTWSDARTSASLIRSLRDAKMNQLVVVSNEALRGDFRDLVGRTPGEVIAAAPCWGHAGDATMEWFVERYAARNYISRTKNTPPRPDAVASFHGTNLLIESVRISSLDRQELQRTIRDLAGADFARFVQGEWMLQSVRP